MVENLICWGRSGLACGAVAAYTVLVGPPALLFTVITGRTKPLFAVGVAGFRLGRWLVGLQLRVEGLDLIPGGPAVFCFNHTSLIDAAVFEALFEGCPGLRALYKSEMNSLPILGPAMRLAGFVPVDRGDRARAVGAVDGAIARLGEGYSFLLAPEGTRSQTGDLGPFKKGAFVMAIRGQVPVVPVAVSGARALMPKGQLFVRSGVVTIRVAPPISTRGLTIDDRDRLGSIVRDALIRTLAGC